MRREPFTVGSYVHAIKRGARGLTIYREEPDKWRCLLMLRHFNDSFHSENWFKDLEDEGKVNTFERASFWPEQRPIVSVLAYTLLHNHFHLVLQEIKAGGIATFMGKVGKGISQHANMKYKESGSLFQGPYRSRTISEDTYFRCVLAYVMVKNVFELYPGGYAKAIKNYHAAYEWAKQYPYSSLMDYTGNRESLILEKTAVRELFPTAHSFQSFAEDYIAGRGVDVESEVLE